MTTQTFVLCRTIFDSKHEMFGETFSKFVQKEIAPHAAKWRAAGQVDREAFEKAGAQGYLMMWADAKYGGAGIKDFRLRAAGRRNQAWTCAAVLWMRYIALP